MVAEESGGGGGAARDEYQPVVDVASGLFRGGIKVSRGCCLLGRRTRSAAMDDWVSGCEDGCYAVLC